MQIGQVQSPGWRAGQSQLASGKPAKCLRHPGQCSWGPVSAFSVSPPGCLAPKPEGQPNGSGLGLVELSTQVKDQLQKVSVSPYGG